MCEQRELTTAGEGFIGSSEVKRSRGQAIYVILNLFQNLVFRCKDAKRRRRKASIEKLFPPIGEGAAQFCHCEGATHVDMLDNSCQFPHCHCEGVKRPSQSQDSCNNDEITTSNASHSTSNNTRQSYIYKILKQVQDDIYSLKRTYRPNVLSSYRLKNKFSLRFTLHSSPKKRAAFTLAEVLITLGIIGVVAAMTIPGMIVKHQKQVTAKRLEQTYSILYQAVNHAQADYGDISSWGMVGSTSMDQDNPTQVQDLITSFADKYLVPYLKLTSSPLYSNNIARQGYVYPKTKDGRSYNFNNAYILELPNSSTLFVSYNRSSSQNIYSLPIIFVDINGKQGPNIVGRDFFMFTFDGADTMKLLPSGISLDRTTLKNKCSKHTSGREYENLYCTALIMIDGWEIRDDYPW